MVDALITHFIEQAKRRKESGGVAGGAAGEVPEVPIVGVVGVGGGENPYEGGFLAIVGVFFRFESFFFLPCSRTEPNPEQRRRSAEQQAVPADVGHVRRRGSLHWPDGVTGD